MRFPVRYPSEIGLKSRFGQQKSTKMAWFEGQTGACGAVADGDPTRPAAFAALTSSAVSCVSTDEASLPSSHSARKK